MTPYEQGYLAGLEKIGFEVEPDNEFQARLKEFKAHGDKQLEATAKWKTEFYKKMRRKATEETERRMSRDGILNSIKRNKKALGIAGAGIGLGGLGLYSLLKDKD